MVIQQKYCQLKKPSFTVLAWLGESERALGKSYYDKSKKFSCGKTWFALTFREPKKGESSLATDLYSK